MGKFPSTSCGMALAHGFPCPLELELAVLRAVADAARAVRAGSLVDAWGGADGWGHAEVDTGDLQALADALDALDREE